MGAACCQPGPPSLAGADMSCSTRVWGDLSQRDGQPVPVKVLRVHDGDTVWLAFAWAGGVYRARCRLAGIDAPEVAPRLTSPTRAHEKAAGLAAKAWLERLLDGPGSTRAVFGPVPDKYGRPLVRLLQGALDVNEEMVRSGHAVRYAGGAKQPFTNPAAVSLV